MAKTPREIVVNIGYKSDGVIPANELRHNPNLKIGDVIELYVEKQKMQPVSWCYHIKKLVY